MFAVLSLKDFFHFFTIMSEARIDLLIAITSICYARHSYLHVAFFQYVHVRIGAFNVTKSWL